MYNSSKGKLFNTGILVRKKEPLSRSLAFVEVKGISLKCHQISMSYVK